MTKYYCIFVVEYLTEDGRERPKHVCGLPRLYVIVSNCSAGAGIYIYIYIYTRGDPNISGI
jgi:hypothetical protein